MTMGVKERKQNKFAEKLDESRACPARGSKYIDLKESISKNFKKFYDGWEKIFDGFKNGKLPLSKKDDTKSGSSDKQTDVLDTFK